MTSPRLRFARTTTARRAPCAITSSSRSSVSMPPMANQGRSSAAPFTCESSDNPAAGRPGLVGVVQVGPQQ